MISEEQIQTQIDAIVKKGPPTIPKDYEPGDFMFAIESDEAPASVRSLPSPARITISSTIVATITLHAMPSAMTGIATRRSARRPDARASSFGITPALIDATIYDAVLQEFA